VLLLVAGGLSNTEVKAAHQVLKIERLSTPQVPVAVAVGNDSGL